MKYIDLFAGIGGFHYGIDMGCLQSALCKGPDGFDDPPDKLVKWECVYSNEWDKYANSVYRRHYGECDSRDIRTVEASEIPDFDLLCGGFPCQSFSIAGKRGGFEDTRGTLFFEIARIVREKQPQLLLLENVKGLLNHDQGRTFGTILSTLDELGYDAQWQVLNSKNFGVPQNRERVYIVGHLRGTPRPKVFPITSTNPEDIKSDIKRKTEVFPTIRATQYKNGDNQTLVANTIDANYYKGINTNPGHASSQRAIKDGTSIRRLTPTECMRLQGFPDDWCDLGANGETISDSQKYKMAGNAVTTNVVTEVIRKLLASLKQEENR